MHCFGHRLCTSSAEDEDEEDLPGEKKTAKETVWDWDLLNDNKAIWLRSPGDVTEDEYTKFYRALSKASNFKHLPTSMSAAGRDVVSDAALPLWLHI